MKGIFYSAMAIMFVTPLILLMVAYLNSTSEVGANLFATKTVGDKLAGFSQSIKNDLPRASSIIGRRAIGSAVDYVDQNGAPLDDAEARLTEVMVNGTINNSIILQDFTFKSWVSELQAKGEIYGFNTDVRMVNVTLIPLDSYDLYMDVIIMVNMSDKTGRMRLQKTYDSAIAVSIEGFADPSYTLNTNGLIKRTIVRPNITIYGTGAFDSAVDERYYMPSQDGPGFLDRLEGRLTNAYGKAGLETAVNVPELQANGLPIKADSDIDYLYFGTGAAGSLINGSFHPWLRLDAAHAAAYGVALQP